MNIKEYLFNFICGSESIYEMATISKNEKWGNNQYRIATHGTAAGDRENPHIHIYPYNDETKHLVGISEEAPEYYRYWENEKINSIL